MIVRGFFIEPYRNALLTLGYSPCDPWNSGYVQNTRLYVGSQEGRRHFMHDEVKLLPIGDAIGAVRLKEVVSGSEIRRRCARGELTSLEEHLGFYDEREGPRYGYVTDDAVELNPPVYARGFQKLWKADEHVTELLEHAIESAR